ncbi:hypothetical protein BH11GEM1_BH11GEM1_27670 [soil metagenome]
MSTRSLCKHAALAGFAAALTIPACATTHRGSTVDKSNRPQNDGRCQDTQMMIVDNPTGYSAEVLSVEDHVNAPTNSSVIITTVAPGAVDTIPEIGRNNRRVLVRLADQPYMAGMPVPIHGLSVSCVAKPD